MFPKSFPLDPLLPSKLILLGATTGAYSESQFVEKKLITAKFYLNSNCQSEGSCHPDHPVRLEMAFSDKVTLAQG